MNRQDVYAKVTAGILARLETGVAPWHQPWIGTTRPCNLITRRPYHGVNAFALGLMGKSPYWLTFRQAQTHGWRVEAGARGVPILFVGRREVPGVPEDEGEESQPARTVPIVRAYHVFNACDVDGIPHDLVTEPARGTWSPLETAEQLIAGIQPAPRITHAGDRAYYSPATDAITLPPRDSFTSAEDYYATAFHELAHWTGGPTRLDRGTVRDATRFGDASYSLEELVAEMGAGFLCGLVGIENKVLDRSASYLANWLRVLKADPSLIVRAASQAQKAADYLAPDKDAHAPPAVSQPATGAAEYAVAEGEAAC